MLVVYCGLYDFVGVCVFCWVEVGLVGCGVECFVEDVGGVFFLFGVGFGGVYVEFGVVGILRGMRLCGGIGVLLWMIMIEWNRFLIFVVVLGLDVLVLLIMLCRN